MFFYEMVLLMSLAVILISVRVLMKYFKYATEGISAKEFVIFTIKSAALVLFIIALLYGFYTVGKIPTDKTTYTEVTAARYTQAISRTFFYSRQYDYIEATFKEDGKTKRYRFPLADVVITEEKEKSMVGIDTIFFPYVLYMTEDDYNKVLDVQKLGGNQK